MPMGEEERRRCCLLGGCGCGSGGPEQRAALRGWLLDKLPELFDANGERSVLETRVDKWLDELFTNNPALTQNLGDDG
jgi:hypothetical protein